MLEGIYPLNMNAFQDHRLPLPFLTSECALCSLFSCRTSGGSMEIFEEPLFSSLKGKP